MEHATIKRILQISCAIALFGGIGIFHYLDINVQSLKAATTCSSIISLITLFWVLYFSFLWKWPFVKYILYKENLNGTWFGTYNSTDSINDKTYHGKIAIVIRQNFLNINIKSFTDKYINNSFGEAIEYDSKSESHRLIYLYSQNEFTPTDDKARKGTSELRLLQEPDEVKLFGNFWTNHNSKGRLNLRKITNKHFTSFKAADSYLKHKK